MLSSHIVGNHKLVLFVDKIGIERSSERIVEKLCKEQNVTYQKFGVNDNLSSGTSLILPSISKLQLNHDNPDIISIIHELKLNRDIVQIFCWATTKNIDSQFLIECLIHMSTIIVTIDSDRSLSILTKRKFGSVKLKEFQHELSKGSTTIKEQQLIEKIVVEEVAPLNPENIGTFKIGDFNTTELEAKRNMKLPFEIISQDNDVPQGKIIYTHDEIDDFDEDDDPDNDLIF